MNRGTSLTPLVRSAILAGAYGDHLVGSRHRRRSPAPRRAPRWSTTFAGFHPRYKTLTYATPDATGLARRLRGVLGATTQVHELPAAVAHPTHEHFVPLRLTVGAATDPGGAVSTLDRMVMGNSIRSIHMR